METVRIHDPRWKKVGAGIRDKHPGSATLCGTAPMYVLPLDSVLHAELLQLLQPGLLPLILRDRLLSLLPIYICMLIGLRFEKCYIIS